MNIFTYTIHTAELLFPILQRKVFQTRLSKQEIKIGTICKDYKNENESISISNKYDIYIIYMISLHKHQK